MKTSARSADNFFETAVATQNANLEQYLKSSVSTASPLQLVIMLYDGAMKQMANGKRAMIQKDTFEQNRALQKAQRIVAELISSLDHRQGGEIASNLFALYTFCYDKLVESNVKDDPTLIDQAMEVFTKLRLGWVELELSTRSTQQEAQSEAA